MSEKECVMYPPTPLMMIGRGKKRLGHTQKNEYMYAHILRTSPGRPKTVPIWAPPIKARATPESQMYGMDTNH